MTAQEVLNEYIVFLWMQFQYDWGWLSNPWLLGIGNLVYLLFFTIKWMVLLAPITIPIFTYKWGGYKKVIKNNDENLIINN